MNRIRDARQAYASPHGICLALLLTGVLLSIAAIPWRPLSASGQDRDLIVGRNWYGAASTLARGEGRLWAGVGGRIVSWPLDAENDIEQASQASLVQPGRINDLAITPNGIAAAVAGAGLLLVDPERLDSASSIIEITGGAKRLQWKADDGSLLVVSGGGALLALGGKRLDVVRWRYQPAGDTAVVVDACVASGIAAVVIQQAVGGGFQNTVQGLRIDVAGVQAAGDGLAYFSANDGIGIACQAESALLASGPLLVELVSDEDGALAESAQSRLSLPGGPIRITEVERSKADLALSFEDTLTRRGGVCLRTEDQPLRCWSLGDVVRDLSLGEQDEILVAVNALGVLAIDGSEGAAEPARTIYGAAGIGTDLSLAEDGPVFALGLGGVAMTIPHQEAWTPRRIPFEDVAIGGRVDVQEAFVLPVDPSSGGAEGGRSLLLAGGGGELHVTIYYSVVVPDGDRGLGSSVDEDLRVFGIAESILRHPELYIATRFGDDGLHRVRLPVENGVDERVVEGPISAAVDVDSGILFSRGREVSIHEASSSTNRPLFSLGEHIVTELDASADAETVVAADYAGHLHWYTRNAEGAYAAVSRSSFEGQISALEYVDGQRTVLVAMPLAPDGRGMVERGVLDLRQNRSGSSLVQVLRLRDHGMEKVGAPLTLPGTVMEMTCSDDECDKVWVAASDGGAFELDWRLASDPPPATASVRPTATRSAATLTATATNSPENQRLLLPFLQRP